MATGTLSILIADDDAGDRKQLRRALKQAGLTCDCIETASIAEALEASDKHNFDCAIVDYRMPGYDGLHGISAIHEQRPFMPIIMATGQGDEMVATEAMKRGASDYITKININAESIRRTVGSVLEKAMLRRKLAQQQEELKNFAHVLAHDLSSPIASIQMFASIVEKEISLENADKVELADHCRRVVDAGRRAGELIDTLYAYTRADGAVTFEPVDMRKVMEDTLSNLQRVILERKARVTHGELPVVTGNVPQLVQLLQNLISNGIKFCEASPPAISIVASLERENIWKISVADNGIGISEQDCRAVFEPFKRLHNAANYPGSGLGLATCKKIVERHGGDIWCESNVGEGTKFFFTLQGARK